MRQVALIVGVVLVLAFGAIHGVLMLVSPRRHAAFVRWYTRGAMLSGVKPGTGTRIAGLIIVVEILFFAWGLAGKILNPENSRSTEKIQFVVTGDSSWPVILVGISVIVVGAYSNLRTSSVANWLESQGVIPADKGAFLRNIKIVGVFLILSAGFLVAVAIRNH
jgi:hypothetical protein